ncbi:hypothetical protein [Streptomyces sp. NPDC006285]|uniref:hypothetical protein n=1 Tax=Streptomyces sp. NPDC006285 TaxID=3364742 RepID=UPI0036B5DD36
MPVPVQLDQHFWAARLHALGVAPRPLRYRHLDAERLSSALAETVRNPTVRVRAREIAAALAEEDGPRQVLSAIERLG